MAMNNMFKGDSYSKKLAKGIKKMKLVSTLPMQLIPKLNQEVEQVLTISQAGSIWLERRLFTGEQNDYKCLGKEKLLSDPTVAKEIFIAIEQAIEQVMASHVRWPLACDAGEWKLTIADSHNKEDQLDGSLIDDSCPEFSAVSDWIREKLNPDLFLFDGNPDKIEKIELIHDKHDLFRTPILPVENYHEELIIDRKTATINYHWIL